MLNRKFFLVCGLATLLLPQVTFAEELKIRIGSDGAYPPYSSKTAAGELIGFEVDLAADLCKRIQAKCEWVLMDFDGLIPALQAGKFEVILASLSITKKRREAIDFSVPYMAGPEYLVASAKFAEEHPPVGTGIVELTKPDSDDKAVLAGLAVQLAGKTVGVGRGTSLETFMRKFFPKAKLQLYEKETTIFLDLASGRVDLGLVDGEATDKFIEDQKKEGQTYLIYGPGFRGDVLGQGIAFGLPKGKDDLRKKLNGAIYDATGDGTVRKLAQKWFVSKWDWSVPLVRLKEMMAE